MEKKTLDQVQILRDPAGDGPEDEEESGLQLPLRSHPPCSFCTCQVYQTAGVCFLKLKNVHMVGILKADFTIFVIKTTS